MIFVPARIEACKINFSRSIFFFFFFRILEVISSYVEEDDESLDFIDQGLKRIMKMILFLKIRNISRTKNLVVRGENLTRREKKNLPTNSNNFSNPKNILHSGEFTCSYGVI